MLVEGPGNFSSLGQTPADKQVLFVSFYTLNTPYADEVQLLKKSLDRFGLRYFIQGFEGKGNWAANTFIKAYFLRDVLVHFADYQSIVWLDADSIVAKSPDFFFQITDCDFSVRGRGAVFSWKNFARQFSGLIFRWKSKYVRALRSMLTVGEELDRCHNCVMYFKNNPASLVIVNDWIARIESGRYGDDQTALQAALRDNHFYKDRFKILNLPEQYAAKANWASNGRLHRQAVITQNQVSEKYRCIRCDGTGKTYDRQANRRTNELCDRCGGTGSMA